MAQEPGQPAENNGLAQQKRHQNAQNLKALLLHHGEVDEHPGRHEEEPQKQAAEGLDVGCNLMPVGRFRQQHAGEEGAKRHGKPGCPGQQAGTKGDKKGHGGEDFALAHHGDPGQNVAQDDTADAKDRHDGDGDLERSQAQSDPDRDVLPADGNGRDQEEADRHVLDDEHGKGAAAELTGEFATVRQKTQDDRRRGESEAPADDGGCREAHAERRGRRADGKGGEDHLQGAEGENAPAHDPDAREGKFQAHGKKQKDHPELCQRTDVLQVVHQGKAMRPDHGAGDHVADHRAEAQVIGEGHHDHGGDQDGQDVEEISGFRHGFCAWGPLGVALRMTSDHSIARSTRLFFSQQSGRDLLASTLGLTACRF